MAGRTPGLPTPEPFVIRKTELLNSLRSLDADRSAVERILGMEIDFRKRISSHVESLPLKDARFAKFKTNPFVLLFHTLNMSYKHVHQIEDDILPAKIFSSMETSAGRMVETVVLPVYGWEAVPSKMHSPESVIDGQQRRRGELRLATLKSGPNCLDDPMVESIANAIISHVVSWAQKARVKKIDFTYGVLYGTKKQSNKKDWHILRNIAEKLPARSLTVHPSGRWDCAFVLDGISVKVTIRVGMDLWNYFSDQQTAFLEMACALIRACVLPTDVLPESKKYTIVDLGEIIGLDMVPSQFNVSILQRSQLEWLFFFARHFCDQLVNA